MLRRIRTVLTFYRTVPPLGGEIGRGRLKQREPTIRRIALVEHTFEHGIYIAFGAVDAQRGLVIHPGKDNDLRATVVAKKQAETSITELRPKLVFAGGTKGAALAIFGPGGIAGDDLKHERSHRSQCLGIGGLGPALRVFGLSFLNGCNQLLKLIKQQRMRIEGPTVDNDHGSERNRSVDVVRQIDLNLFGQCCHALWQAARKRDDVVLVAQHVLLQEA